MEDLKGLLQVFMEQFMLCFIRMFRNNNPPAMPDFSSEELTFSCPV
jgi:hypothetical protein